MSAPRASSSGTVSLKGAAIPEGYGVAIPNNPQALLAMIQRQHKSNVKQISKQSDVIGRAQKQEQQREMYENKLMEFEDFIYGVEGAARLNRQFEHMRMETEDELSMQVEMVKRRQKKVDFKEQVRLEVEERLKREEQEREAKRKAAEERRAGVVERLRKKAEEEERRRLEAEAALLRIQEEAARKEQQALDRLASDRSSMQLEDDLSRLAEQDFKEQQEKQAWERGEREKLAEFERALQAKDAAEAEARKARMAALEEKKAKLAELKRLQNLNGAQDGAGAANQAQALQSTREEAAKLDKQLRIQNKAKFVTKKIQTSASAASEAVVVTDAANLLGADETGPSDAHASSAQRPTGHAQSAAQQAGADGAAVQGAFAMAHALGQADDPNGDRAAFEATVVAADSEAELKALQKQLMADKRALRLEQKQRLSAQGGGKAGAQDPSEIERAKELRRRIEDITQREGIVQRRLQLLLAAGQGVTGAAVAGSAAEYAKAAKATAAASTAELTALTGASAAALGALLGPVEGATGAPAAAAVDGQVALYAKAEHLLREGQQLLQWLSEKKGTSDASAGSAPTAPAVPARAPALGSMRKSFGRSFVFVRTDEASTQRRATLLVLEALQLAKDIDPAKDPGGYGDSLSEISKQLKAALEEPRVSTSTAFAPNEPAVPQKVLAAEPHKIQASSSASSIPGPVKAEALLTSASCTNIASSAPLLQSVPESPQERTDAAPKEPAALLLPAATEAASAPHAASPAVVEVKSSGDTIAEEAEPEAEQEVGVAEETVNFEELPGWEECLTTSMASAAHHAAFHGYTEVLDCLCRYFDCFVMDKKGRTPLFYAALQNRLSCVASLVSLDPQWIDVGDQNGDTSLHAAAIANGVEVLSFLLQCEASPDTANYAGLTPCHLARSKDALQVLCDANAMPYCVDGKSRMPLWFACNEGRGDCVEFLCAKTPAEYLLWPDEEGETCLHRAAMNGHAQCVEALAQHLPSVEDLYAVNKKQHTAAHVASTAGVLKALYENGASLWTPDPKGRMPLFTASFFGRADCIAFLLDVASSGSSTVSTKAPVDGKVATDDRALVATADFQGDTPLHVACLCGHVRCVSLLLFFTQCTRNKQGLLPDQLATKAGHHQIAQMVAHVHLLRESEGLSSMQIYGCEFSVLSAVTLYYGARWAKLYDVSFDTVYYLDRATGQSQWERPAGYDEAAAEEQAADKTREVLRRFYGQYNPEKLSSMNDILLAYKGKYTELFISLANKYSVQDLSMFQGVSFD